MHNIDDFTYYTITESANEYQNDENLCDEKYSGWLDDFGWI